MSLRLRDARSFTFEISPYDYDFQWPDYDSVVNELKSVVTIKECGMCPLYSTGSNVAQFSMETKQDKKRKAES
ncbi:hypothetical protein VIGAN_01013500 [Vigna angularis var. angularis]|uniref:Uncharacterized protein n=1 Tax=Vigna angularis var. angularis TaxID=157739 RepID=A0A0S3QWK0_PHAAN|nr:hypothetical protein VIGAN_01013500 [Vigna angularis var. angularis]